MSDKLNSAITFPITFVEGEIPSPAKLNAFASQIRAVAESLERAVGDVHSQSWPYSGSSDTTLSDRWGKSVTTGGNISGSVDRFLDIANLARLIGPASNLNPKQLNGDQTITEDVPVGVHEFSLRYPVKGSVSAVTTDDTSLTNRVNATSLAADGDYSISSLGKIRSVTATAGGTITYLANSSNWGGGTNYNDAHFNVYPDPNQSANGTGLVISALDGSGRRTITLPVIEFQQSDVDVTDIELTEKDINFNRQMRLPTVLSNHLTAGDEIPAGFMFLKNVTTNEVYDDAVFYYDTVSTVLIANADLASAITAGNAFALFTVGTDITSSIDDLRNKTRHSHDRTWGEPFIHVDNLIGQYEEAGLSGVFGPSTMDGNPFSQYLHRDGYRSSEDTGINDSNAMRGDIAIGRTTGTPGTYVGAGESYKIGFGGVNSTYIKRESTGDLTVYNNQGNTVFDSDSMGGHHVQVNPVLHAQSGMLGDLAGTVGAFNTNGIAPYVTSGTITKGSGVVGAISGYTADLILPSNIRAKTWYGVSLMLQGRAFNVTTGLDDPAGWYPCPQSLAGTALSVENSCSFSMDSSNQILVYVIGSDFTAAEVIPYRIIVWYQP